MKASSCKRVQCTYKIEGGATSLYAVSAVLGLLRKKRELSDVFALLIDHLLKEKGGILYRNGVTQSEALRPGQIYCHQVNAPDAWNPSIHLSFVNTRFRLQQMPSPRFVKIIANLALLYKIKPRKSERGRTMMA